MLLFTLVLAAVSLKPLEAVIIDSDYMPSAQKQQADKFSPKKLPKQRESIVVREKQNEDYHVEESYPTVKPLYKYGYSVFDPYTLDIKSQWEHRDGDYVRGAYNMLEADGSLRIVEYTSDKDTGFRAIVKKIPFFLEQSRRQVENIPKYTGRNNPAIKPNNYNYQNNQQPENPAPVQYHPNLAANFHQLPQQQQQQQQQHQQQPPQLQQPQLHQPQLQQPQQQQQQNEVNSHFNRQSENYVRHGNYYKQQYLSKQKQSSSAPVVPADLYKRLMPAL